MARVSGKWHAVVMADVVSSRKMMKFAAWRDQRLERASEEHRENGWVRYGYAVTAWDEFQAVATGAEHAWRIAFDLRRRFQPAGLRIGVGIGEAALPRRDGSRLNEQATGEAFILAREALRKVEAARDAREGRVSLVRCAAGRVEEFGNLVFGLQDPLVLAITARQWANIDTVVERGSQKNAARKLRVEKSTVSRSLARAKYWPIEESIAAAGRLFGEIVREEEARRRRP